MIIYLLLNIFNRFARIFTARSTYFVLNYFDIVVIYELLLLNVFISNPINCSSNYYTLLLIQIFLLYLRLLLPSIIV